jgi:hypothetical protein
MTSGVVVTRWMTASMLERTTGEASDSFLGVWYTERVSPEVSGMGWHSG